MGKCKCKKLLLNQSLSNRWRNKIWITKDILLGKTGSEVVRMKRQLKGINVFDKQEVKSIILNKE